MRRYLIRALLALGFLVLPCLPPSAQESNPNGHIRVQVLDQSGAIVQNARVLILPTPDTLKGVAKPDEGGEFQFEVPPGTYDVRAFAQGFLRQTQQVEVQGGRWQSVQLTLSLGQLPPCCMALPLQKKLSGGPVDFPEEVQAISPDGRYAILAVDRDSGSRHTLLLEHRTRKIRRPLFVYERHVTVLWHVNSKVFAVTEYVTNDNSNCRIYFADDTAHPIAVLERLPRELPESANDNLKVALSSHRAYVEAEDWIYPTTLLLMVSPYSGDPRTYFAPGSGYGAYELHMELDYPPLPINSHPR
jgi:hypothetical protein